MKNQLQAKRLKEEARCALTGRHAILALVTLLVYVLNIILNILAVSASPSSSGMLSTILMMCFSLLVNIIYYILLSGQYKIYLNLCRDNPFKWTDLFAGFREHPEPVAVFGVLQYVISFMLTQICSWFIAAASTLLFVGEGVWALLISAVCAAAAVAVYIFVEISLSMVLFIHAGNPWLTFTEMIQKGWQLMHGRRVRYFYLQLSFIGLYALGILSFGIGLLFVRPYMLTAEGMFYRKISGQ